MSDTSLRVISLNCWGLKYLSKHRHARLHQIGVELNLANPQPDIVGLQECWTQQDYLSIREETKGILPHGKYYHSGIFGGGLAILSRWPIEESNMYRYPLNGRPTAFFRGDWFVGKGVACARIRTGLKSAELIEVFCTHLHAPYEREPNDSYICHRTAQAWEIAKLMRGAAERGHLVIGLGDFNMIPSSLAHRLIETHGRVTDTWKELHPDSSIGAAEDKAEIARGKPMPSADFSISKNGTTCDSAHNTWRWAKPLQKRLDNGENVEVDGNVSDPRAKRLDYVFYGHKHNDALGWAVKDARVGMLMRHPKLQCSLSDHFSVEVTLFFGSPGSTLTDHGLGTGDVNNRPEHRANPDFLPVETYDEILAMVKKYHDRETKQRRLRVGHFGLSLFISIVLLIAIWWSPHNYVAFILMLVSTLGLSAGVIDGLIGGLFVGSELRALKEFRWEMLNVKEMSIAALAVKKPGNDL